MSEQTDVSVKRAVLHILDNNINVPVLSSEELDVSGDIKDFIEKHIIKVLNDTGLKNAVFVGEANYVRDLCSYLASDMQYLVQGSIDLAKVLFDLMCKNVDIAAGDLICCIFEFCRMPYFGMLKLNYREGYTHHAQQMDEGNTNTVIRHRTILPSEGQRADECFFINLEDLSIKIIEKEYEINGEKQYYLSQMLLQCQTELSGNDKMKILNKVTKKINKKYFDEDFEKVAMLKKVVSENLEESDAIHLEDVMDQVFCGNTEIKREYIEEVQKAGLMDIEINLPEKLTERKFKTQKIKTDTGIELNFPSNLYDNSEKIEFINNPDGTISILIKNVGKIMNR